MTVTLFGHDLSGPTTYRPTNAEIGQLYFDTTINQELFWNGSSWVMTSGVAPGTGKFLPVVVSTVLTSANAGQIVLVSLATSAIITLPDSTANPGFEITVINALATTIGAGTSIALTTGTDLVIGDGITPSAGKGIINTEATNHIGDTANLISDGAGNWWIRYVTGTWARHS